MPHARPLQKRPGLLARTPRQHTKCATTGRGRLKVHSPSRPRAAARPRQRGFTLARDPRQGRREPGRAGAERGPKVTGPGRSSSRCDPGALVQGCSPRVGLPGAQLRGRNLQAPLGRRDCRTARARRPAGVPSPDVGGLAHLTSGGSDRPSWPGCRCPPRPRCGGSGWSPWCAEQPGGGRVGVAGRQRPHADMALTRSLGRQPTAAAALRCEPPPPTARPVDRRHGGSRPLPASPWPGAPREMESTRRQGIRVRCGVPGCELRFPGCSAPVRKPNAPDLGGRMYQPHR